MRPIFVINNNSKSKIVSNLISKQMDFKEKELSKEDLVQIDALIEENDAALLIIGLESNKDIQFYLDKCRTLRIPYIFVKDTIPLDFNINTIILPITNLEEEREKGPFASSFARHFNNKTKIYQPNDYGTRALQNIEAIKTLFDSLKLTYSTIKGKTNSSKIELEAGKNNKSQNNTILIISASRDYGLDDIIFGPKERKIIKTIDIPTMIINPRGDLYALCD